MSRLSLPLAQLIHDNLSIVMTFAFSRDALETLRRKHFAGEWKYLDKLLFENAERRAVKAFIELATFVRYLDADANIADYLRQTGSPPLGRVFKNGQPDEDLYLRDLTNKIVHAAGFEWDFTNGERPKFVCISNDTARWSRAEVELVTLAGVCGQLVI